MSSGLSQSEIDKYLKLDMAQNRPELLFKDKQTFLNKIDSLPRGPGWQCEIFEATGDECDEEGKEHVEVFELWKRDPVECIRELLSNPSFACHMKYAPERRYEDEWMKKPILSEMWSGTWWESVQNLLPPGATVVPVILASDKTQLSNFSGDKSAWPVYLTIGNIEKAVRRSPSYHATVLLGYLPVSKMECFSKSKRLLATYQLFHDCMRSLLAPLIKAGKDGVEMVCADGFLRKVYPVLAAYIADHPEQCLVACCQQNHCPRCLVKPERRGQPVESPLRNPAETASMIRETLRSGGQKPRGFEEAGLQAIDPFWKNLPYCNIFACMTPDLLHQLHKGMFKDHTVKWATACVDGKEDEVDRRFCTMPTHPDLRHFHKGISLVSQWTGNEYKHMEKVFLGVVAGSADTDVVKAVRAVLDFISYAHFETHTNDFLSGLNDAWTRFHSYKQVFVRLGVRKDFNGIPKLHSMTHYLESIRLLGTADGYNSEGPERLHIDFAKVGYRASNRKQYIHQMTVWLDRQDAVRRFEAYLRWLKHGRVSQFLRTGEEEDGNHDEDDGENIRADQPALGADASEGIYTIARKPTFPNIVRTIVAEFCAPDFAQCLEDFTTPQSLSFLCSINSYTTFVVYKHFKKALPQMSQVSKKLTSDSIRAFPARLGATASTLPRRLCAQAAQFSTVLAFNGAYGGTRPDDGTNTGLYNPIDGLTVAQVRVIFCLPETVSYLSKHPLAYVEWFTPFQPYGDITGMFSVAPSQRNRRRRVSIIPITAIVRSCHLIPVWGRAANIHWTSENVLERCTRFYVNTYLRHTDFVLFRFLVDRWRKTCNTSSIL
ncbi:hypothetical protein BC835DRAFT_1550045 [Cytidiella melzeri]|nr:hypothetical protein BC835DRAFT_1550045 [Cytidiella melzeri]